MRGRGLEARADQAVGTLGVGVGGGVLRGGVATAMGELPFIPLHQLVNYWAARKGVVYEPREDERSLAMNAHLVR